MQPSFAYLPSPEHEYLSLEQLSKWLDIDVKTVRKLIQRGDIPDGKPRAGGKRLYWCKAAAAVAKWQLDNLERYPQRRKRSGKIQGTPPQNGV